MSRSLLPVALHYFDRVATTGSIQAAARAQNVAASAIDRQIIGLENRMGVKLFERLPKGMRLTAAGKVLVELVHRWRAEERNAVAEIFLLQGVQQGQVNLFAMDSHATSILPQLVRNIAAAHPLINLSIQLGSTDEAVAALLSGRADLIITFNLPQRREVRQLFNCVLPFGCVVAPDHPLLNQSEVRFQDAVAYPIALQNRSLPIRMFLETQYSWLFAEPHGCIETNSLHLVKNLVRSGNYVAFTSELDAAPELASGSLRFIPIAEIEAVPQTSSIAIDASKPLNSLVEIVADCAAMVIESALSTARAAQSQPLALPAI
jgi:DNA-binding transcriptional LysR family regulator